MLLYIRNKANNSSSNWIIHYIRLSIGRKCTNHKLIVKNYLDFQENKTVESELFNFVMDFLFFFLLLADVVWTI